MRGVTQADFPINIPNTFGNYQVINIIGCGGTSVVARVKNLKEKCMYAAKITSRQDLVNQGIFLSFEQELRVHQTMNHPNIANLVDVVYDKENIYAIQELCINGDLFNWMQRGIFSNIITIRRTMYQIVSAVAYLHSKGIAHMDLKPENILLDSDFNVKLTDFGCCETNIQKISSDIFGTIHYTAPEVLAGKIEDKFKADVWSIGIIFYAIIYGGLPSIINDQGEEVPQLSLTGIDKPPEGFPVFICKCLKLDPKERPTASEILEDQWFNPEKKTVCLPKLVTQQRAQPHQRIKPSISAKFVFPVRPNGDGFKRFRSSTPISTYQSTAAFIGIKPQKSIMLDKFP